MLIRRLFGKDLDVHFLEHVCYLDQIQYSMSVLLLQNCFEFGILLLFEITCMWELVYFFFFFSDLSTQN